MKFGKLRDQIIVQQLVTTDNISGGSTGNWTDLKTIWAKIEPIQGKRRLEFGQTFQDNPFKITVRFDSMSEVDNTQNFRFLFKSRIYNIVAFINVNERDGIIEVLANKKNIPATSNPFGATVTDANNIYSPVTLGDGDTYECVQATPIVADFSADDTAPVTGQTITFTDISTGSPTSWCWDFGDGNFSLDQNPKHEYFIPGSYTIVLIASNGNSGDTETKVAHVVVSAIGAYNSLGFWFVAKHGIILDDSGSTDINAIKASAIPNPIGNGSFVGMAAGSITANPTRKALAANSLPAVDFDGVDQYLEAGINWGDFFDNNDHTIIIVMKANTIGTDLSLFANDGVLTETGGNIGMHLQQPDKIFYYQFVSGGVKVEDTITLGTYFVVVARKKSAPEQGIQVNNKAEVTRTDANIGIGNTKIRVGRNFGTAFSDIEIAEIILAPANYLSDVNISEIKTLLYNRYNIVP